MRAMTWECIFVYIMVSYPSIRLAQLVERQSHELVVVGSSPTSDNPVSSVGRAPAF